MSGDLTAVIAAIDAANAGDPNRVEFEGAVHAKEVLHAELVTSWLLRLDPDAGDLQRIAARAHHLRRWALPRTEYPEGRRGYLAWRTELKRRHAAGVAEIMRAHGYGADAIERVGEIIRKVGLASDPEVQAHEDALCLTFLQTQLDETASKLGDDKTVDVLVKTLAKMSPAAVAIAGELDYTAAERRLVERAVAEFSA